MVQGQQLRARFLSPLLRLLEFLRVTPDHLTFLSLIAGLAFCPLYFRSPEAAFLALVLHVLLDGLDGPLARHLGIASRRGSFTDTMADQLVVTATTITLMKAGVIGIAAGGVYVFVYGIVVAFAMVRNAMAIPYSWLIRPRFIIYLWMPLEVWWWSGTIEIGLWIASSLLAAKMFSGFLKIRKAL
jgi:phosphatidylglycerophosphate synthase